MCGQCLNPYSNGMKIECDWSKVRVTGTSLNPYFMGMIERANVYAYNFVANVS